ncbi:diacylglycerol kinase family protein [Flagellimonas sp. DF-77]|uniref:diacylglycerol kinase family protein n=1 Tax=Flagellimonas algarum TaxID=3230298 RepID=UPI003398ADA9
MPKESFLKNRIRSVGFAFKGLFLLLRTEASIKIQFFIALLATAAGFYFEISREEWMVQLLAIGLVMGIEGLNTAVEKISDFVHPEYHKKIGFIKDIAAGAVMAVSLIAGVIGLIIYLPKLIGTS